MCGYQIKLELLARPKDKLAPAEQKAIELAARDWATFLANTMRQNTPKRSGRLAGSIRTLVFGKKGSAKAFYDLAMAPYAAEVMRGVKNDRVIMSRYGSVMRFTAQSGETIYRRKVTKRKSFGLRVPERMRNNMAVNERLKQILVAWLTTQLTGKQQNVQLGPITLG